MKPTPSALLAVVFALALVFLVGGRSAQARAASDPGPFVGELTLTAADPALGPATATLDLSVTVGTDLEVCPTATAVTVTVGTLVNVCYNITNNTAVTLTTHTLRDQLLESILADFPYNLSPGASAYLTRALTATTTTDLVGTWTGTLPIAGYTVITGSCSFPDISATGQALNLADDGLVDLTLPFHFSFYDRYTNRLRVSNNGALLFDQPNTSVSFVNSALPTASLPHGLAVFWDDLDSDTGQVYAGLYTYTVASQAAALTDVQSAAGLTPQGDTPYYVIQYQQRSHFPGPTNTATFAVGLSRLGYGIPGYIFICYPDTNFANATFNNGASATLGVNHNGSTATQYSYNTARPELTGSFGVGYMPTNSSEGYVGTAAAHIAVLDAVRLPAVFR